MKYFALSCLFIYTVNLNSQNTVTSAKTFYKWFDSIIDISNTTLLNGIEFKEKYRTLEDNNQYFLEYSYLPGNLVYSGQPYYDVEMKYDVNSDNLIIKLSNSISGQFAFQLIKHHVKEFQIEDHFFINSAYLESDKTVLNHDGFLEVIHQSKDLSTYKKHIKNSEQRRNDKFTYTKFIYRSNYYMNYKNKIHSIKTKKDIIQLFPDLKKNINVFYNKNKPLSKFSYDSFLSKLTGYLNESIKN